jgi:arsenate reductase
MSGVPVSGAAAYLAARADEAELITPARRALLERLAAFVHDRRERGDTARLVFVCTHNSRRSQLAMVWAAAAAAWVGLDRVEAFSAGTEATAFHRNAVAALARARLPMNRLDSSANSRYAVHLVAGSPPLKAFSKTLDHPSLPRSGFAAVMTCSEADAACPVVIGASARIALPYQDPRTADGTPQEVAAYDACCAEIAREILWAMSCAARLK